MSTWHTTWMHDQSWLRMICPCVKMIIVIPETENAYKEMTRAKVKVFSLTRSRPRKNQIFWPVHLNHTFLHLRTPGESCEAFFSNLPAYNLCLAPLKCLTTYIWIFQTALDLLACAEIDRNWLKKKKNRQRTSVLTLGLTNRLRQGRQNSK